MEKIKKAKIMYKNREEIAIKTQRRILILKNQNDIDELSINNKTAIYRRFGTLNFNKIYGFIGEIG